MAKFWITSQARVAMARWIAPDTHRVVPANPTPKMLRAACSAMSPGKRPTVEWVSNSEKHGIRYVAMIDAAP